MISTTELRIANSKDDEARIVNSLDRGEYVALLNANDELCQFVGGDCDELAFLVARRRAYPGVPDTMFPEFGSLVKCWIEFKDDGTWEAHDHAGVNRWRVTGAV